MRTAYTFFILDGKARSQSFYLSTILGFAAGAITILTGETSTTKIGLATIAATSIAFWLHLIFYLKIEIIPEKFQNVGLTRRSWWRRIVTVTVPAVSVSAAAATTTLARREAIATAQSVSVDSAEAVRAISVQQSPRVPISEIVRRARTAKSVFAKQKLPASVFQASVNSRIAEIASELKDHVRPFDGNVARQSRNGKAGIEAIGDVLVANFTCDAVFPRESGEGIIIAKPRITVMVYDSLFNGMIQNIDSIVWVNTTFKNCLIRYTGGPILMSRTSFDNCVLDPSMKKVPTLSNLIVNERSAAITWSS